METLKHCSKCNQDKEFSAFQKNKTMSDGLEYWCRECKAAGYEILRDKRKEEGLCHCGREIEEGYKTCIVCRTRNAFWSAKYLENNERKDAGYRQRVKTKVFAHYGTICACCGTKYPEFLTIDHVGGGGNKHRKEAGVGAGSTFYAWLIRNNFPEGYRTLCYNCNCARGHLGYCPHEKEYEDVN